MVSLLDWFRSPSPAPATPNSTAFDVMCTARPGQVDNLTVHIQAGLVGLGSSIQADGIWTGETCKEWWRLVGEPLSVEAVTRLRPDLANCQAMLLPSCPKPGLTLERALQIALVIGIAYGAIRIAREVKK